MPKVKIAIIADPHFADFGDTGGNFSNGTGTGVLGGLRRCSTAGTRFDSFKTDVDANVIATGEDIDFVWCTGDEVELSSADLQKTTVMDTFITKMDSFGKPWHTCLSNHITAKWTGVGDKPAISEYYNRVEGATNNGARDNELPSSSVFESYTFDVNGIRFLNLYCPFNVVPYSGFTPTNETPSSEDHVTWLVNELARAGNMPVVILTHAHIWDIVTTNSSFQIANSNLTNVQNAIHNNGNVQMVMAGHWHFGETEGNLDGARSGNIGYINDTYFYPLQGSVWNGETGSSPTEAGLVANDTHAHYIIEIDANAIGTPFGKRANIKINGFERSAPYTENFKRYLVG